MQGSRDSEINLTQESVDERVSLTKVSRVSGEGSGVRSNESGTSEGSNWGSVGGKWGRENGVIGLTILVQVNATVSEIVVELRGFVGKDSNLAFSTGGLGGSGVGDDGGGSLGEWVGERRAVRVGESSAVVQTGVGVVVGQQSGGWGVDWDIGLAVLVQIDALRVQVIGKLRMVWGPLAVKRVDPLGGGACQEEADDLSIKLEWFN